MIGLFSKKPPLDEASALWLFDVFDWCLAEFDAGEFYSATRLVLPSNDFFPGRENSVQGMANLIFRQVQAYAGMAHWPMQLMEPNWCPAPQQEAIRIDGSRRGDQASPVTDTEPLPVAYDPAMIGNPEALIAAFAHTLAQYLGSTAKSPPPGGLENWAQATEVMAVFLGFGVMFSNTAFTFRTNKCGSCGGAAAQRSNYLSQYDITYALALFCVLKQIPKGEVLPHVKKSLRGFFKQSLKDIQGRDTLTGRLAAQYQ